VGSLLCGCGCCAGAVRVLNKQSKARMLSKGLVLGAVRVLSKQARQGLGVRLGALCGCKVRVYPSKDKMVWLGAVGGCCAGAVVDAVRVVLGGCKVKVLGLVRWWVLCGLSYNQVLG
jgi:hypothetical protein